MRYYKIKITFSLFFFCSMYLFIFCVHLFVRMYSLMGKCIDLALWILKWREKEELNKKKRARWLQTEWTESVFAFCTSNVYGATMYWVSINLRIAATATVPKIYHNMILNVWLCFGWLFLCIFHAIQFNEYFRAIWCEFITSYERLVSNSREKKIGKIDNWKFKRNSFRMSNRCDSDRIVK